jgi:hypothetical protein
MSRMSLKDSTAGTYQPNLFSSTMEQGSLPAELLKRTSSLDSDKVTQPARWWSSWTLPAAKESFLAFCTEVLQYNKVDEDDQIARNARDAALAIAESAYSRAPNRWRSPRVATDGGGGVRLTWKLGETELRAVFPADARRMQYLYLERGDWHSMIKNFTAATLCSQFDWLLSKR